MAELTEARKTEMIRLRDEWITALLSTEPADQVAARAAAEIVLRHRTMTVMLQPATDAWSSAYYRDSAGYGYIFSSLQSTVTFTNWDWLSRLLSPAYDTLDAADRTWINSTILGGLTSAIACAVTTGSVPRWLPLYDICVRSGLMTVPAAASEPLEAARALFRASHGFIVQRSVFVSLPTWVPVRILDRPAILRTEITDPVTGTRQLHCGDGPARQNRDRTNTLYAWHGTGVPDRVIRDAPLTWDHIQNVPREFRRVAIEITGWDTLEPELRYLQISTAPDPGNPGHELALYQIPGGFFTMFGGALKLIMMTNGSPGEDGKHARIGETVPDNVRTPLGAQAWAFGVPQRVYKELQRRT